MPVELSDSQYEVLRKASEFLQEAATKPETRREFERMAKKLRPEIETTDDIAAAAAEPYIAELRATQTKMDEFLTAQETRARESEMALADQARDAAFGRLRGEGYTDEGVETIRKLMVDRNIADPEAAAALFDRLNPKPAEGTSAWEPDSWDFRGEAVARDVEGLFQNEDLWADKEVANVLRDIRAGN